MTHPTAHAVEDRAAGREPFPIDALDVGDRNVVDVLDETCIPIEGEIRRLIDPAERAR